MGGLLTMLAVLWIKPLKCLDYFIKVLLRKLGIERQGEDLLGKGFCDLHGPRGANSALICGLFVNGNRIVDSCMDVLRLEGF